MAVPERARPGSRPRRLAYLGTPDVAVPPLVALHAAGFEIACVVTGPDRRRGRGGSTSPTPVKATALDLGLPVTHELDDVLAAGVELGVVVAFGRIIPVRVLEAVPMLNLHFSLLPRWRGAAPVERAILAGDPITGVCVMEVAEGLDTGAVYARAEVEIGERDTLSSLRGTLVEVGSQLLVAQLAEGLSEPVEQTGEISYASKITSVDLRIDWEASAVSIDRLVRVGGAHTSFRAARFKIHEARPVPGMAPAGEIIGNCVGTGDGLLELTVVQPEGRSRQRVIDWRNGSRVVDGERLGQ